MNKKIVRRIIFIVSAVLIAGIFYVVVFTGEDWDDTSISYADSGIPYAILSPDRTISLPASLAEVSGISHYGNSDLVLVEDERGEVSIFDYDNETIKGTYKFGKEADYEDIAVIDDIVYVLKSNGNVYRIEWLGKPEQHDKKYDTVLSGNNDAEGLCYDHVRNSLLVVCKGADVTGLADGRSVKAVYEFDLILKTILPDPLVTIDLKQIKENAMQTVVSKDLFQPSAIAVHPVSGDLYILSSVGKLLLVADRKGVIKSIQSLPRSVFRQPEGICFAPNADMFIANEARGAFATILVFKYLN